MTFYIAKQAQAEMYNSLAALCQRQGGQAKIALIIYTARDRLMIKADVASSLALPRLVVLQVPTALISSDENKVLRG